MDFYSPEYEHKLKKEVLEDGFYGQPKEPGDESHLPWEYTKKVMDWEAKYFEDVVSLDVNPKKASTWVSTELFRLFNESNSKFDSSKVKAKDLKILIDEIKQNKITQNSGKEILRELFETSKNINEILESGDYDSSDMNIGDIIDTVLLNCENEVSRYKDGEEKLIGFFIGQVNKETKGKVSHEVIISELKKKLKN